jgi:subtilisin family serine protease
MAPSSNDPLELEAQQRVRDQVKLIRDANKGHVETDTGDDADFNFLYDPRHVLLATEDEPRLRRALRARQDVFEGGGRRVDDDSRRTIPGLSLWELPKSRDNGPKDLVEAVGILDDQIDEGVVTLDNYMHLASTGNGRACPATEPEETGLVKRWPPKTTRGEAGTGVRVSVVDTGEYVPPTNTNQTAQLREYTGHGMFVAGVVACRAPKADIRNYWFAQGGGAIRESEMVTRIMEAVDDNEADTTTRKPFGAGRKPHVINLSAGCYTRKSFGLKSFRVLHQTVLKGLTDTVLVAAAGNDGSDRSFFPAASGWAVGVGSLDRNGTVSSFSNYHRSADVFVLGRNHVNDFPVGEYVCREAPNKGDVRYFDSGLARWSGTSFSAPLFAGLLADFWSASPRLRAREAKNRLVAAATYGQDSVHGPYRFLGRSQYLPRYA